MLLLLIRFISVTKTSINTSISTNLIGIANAKLIVYGPVHFFYPCLRWSESVYMYHLQSFNHFTFSAHFTLSIEFLWKTIPFPSRHSVDWSFFSHWTYIETYLMLFCLYSHLNAHLVKEMKNQFFLFFRAYRWKWLVIFDKTQKKII